MPADVICISRTDGAEGEAVGKLVAERLGFRHVDEAIVVDAAARRDLWPEELADVERRRSGWRDAFDRGGAPAETLRTLIKEAIAETAEQGRVVIVAHAASLALAGREQLLRVLVTASPETRAGRLEVTAKALAELDRGREDYLRRFYRVERELPTHYDLVASTDRLSPEQAAELVVRAATG